MATARVSPNSAWPSVPRQQRARRASSGITARRPGQRGTAHDQFSFFLSVSHTRLSSLTTSPYRVIVIATCARHVRPGERRHLGDVRASCTRRTSRQTRVRRGPTPLYRARKPSLATVSRRQCSDDVYFDAMEGCEQLAAEAEAALLMSAEAVAAAVST